MGFVESIAEVLGFGPTPGPGEQFLAALVGFESHLDVSNLRVLPDMAKKKHVVGLIASLTSTDDNPGEIGQ